MRVHVVSDVHGNADALARAGEGADALVVLGDLIDFVDYHRHEKGILGRLFGAEKVKVFADLRRSGDREATIAYSRELWGSLDDPAGLVEEAIREQYAELFGAMTAPTYATPGNVDAPSLWQEFAEGGIHVLDGDVAKIGGLRFGFVGGSLRPDGVPRRTSSAWTPYLRPHDEFAEAVAGLGQIDVLCSHIPPDVPELTYDVVTKRTEAGAPSLREAVEREQPRWSLFGHVHQPLADRMRLGRTECCNVGHFKLAERPFVLRW
ncbi:MAG: metallophosphoesterase [Actinophytocola sp.]|nr:metallophosphoesterase [Actinophytocola sp.]